MSRSCKECNVRYTCKLYNKREAGKAVGFWSWVMFIIIALFVVGYIYVSVGRYT